jgi:phosphoglucomutase
VVNPLVDPTWRFMTLDWDGKIRMDCSSPYAMASLIERKDEYDRSPPATTPTPTGTASSRPTAG